MPTMHIIALCGHAGAGKDTVADILVTHAGFRKLAFADALKGELANAFGVPYDCFHRQDLKSQPMEELALERCVEPGYCNAVIRAAAERPGALLNVRDQLTRRRTPRESMQLWGTEYRRAQDSEYWTRQLAARINHYQREQQQRGFVVTDCRYRNEWDRLRAMGGRLWQVKRPGIDAGGTHSSATDGTEFGPELVISNAHDIRHLQQLVLGEYWALDAGLEGLQVTLP